MAEARHQGGRHQPVQRGDVTEIHVLQFVVVGAGQGPLSRKLKLAPDVGPPVAVINVLSRQDFLQTSFRVGHRTSVGRRAVNLLTLPQYSSRLP